MTKTAIMAKLQAGETLSAEEIAYLNEHTAEPAPPPVEAREDLPEDVRATLTAAAEREASLSARVAELEEARQREAYMAEAKTFSRVPGLSTEQIANQLRLADKHGTKEEAEELRQHFASTHSAMGESDLFKAFGSSRGGDEGSAVARLDARARQIADEKGVAYPVAKIEAGRANPKLYEEAQRELAKAQREEA